MFKKKEPIKSVEAIETGKDETVVGTITEQLKSNPFKPKMEMPPKPPEMSTQEIIANNTELWYKEQVLELLADTHRILKKFENDNTRN